MLSDLLQSHQSSPISISENTGMVDTETPISYVSTTDSTGKKSRQTKRSPADLDCLAAALGGVEVLQDFRDMVNIVSHMAGNIDSSTARAFRAYANEYLEDENSTEGGPPNFDWTINDAVQLYNRERLTSDCPDSQNGSQDNPPVGQGVGSAFQLYTSGRGHRKLGEIQEDLASFQITRRYRTYKQVFQEEIQDSPSDRRKHVIHDTELLPGKSGPQASDRAYKQLLSDCFSPDDPGKRADLVSANSRGSQLLRYEIPCGREHPLWLILPTRNFKCPRCPEERKCRIKRDE